LEKKESVVANRKKTDPIFEIIFKIIPEWLTPNMLIIISLVLAIIYSFFVLFAGTNDFSPGLFIAFPFLFLSALLDAMDGALARFRKTESRRGGTI